MGRPEQHDPLGLFGDRAEGESDDVTRVGVARMGRHQGTG